MEMLAEVPLRTNNILEDYRRLSGEPLGALRKKARSLKNVPIIHINATRKGGGVAELLESQVPFERALGLRSRWFTLQADRYFFGVTKKIHHLLQGGANTLTDKERRSYREVQENLVPALRRITKGIMRGVVVIHDPQPLLLVGGIGNRAAGILRLHVDLSRPNAETLGMFEPFINQFDRVVVSSRRYRDCFLWKEHPRLSVIAPAINPILPKNRPMPIDTARLLLTNFGVNCTRPFAVQVSRFDVWKDPIGVVDAYYEAKNAIPSIQLVLAGFDAAVDDPEAGNIFAKLKKYSAGDRDIHLFFNPKQLKQCSHDTFINALYSAADVVFQKSLKEGFGLTITEAMWKGKPVIAGDTEGARLQITNGKNGIIVASPKAAGRALVRLLKNKTLRERLGRNAHRSVAKKFLFGRYIREHLQLYTAVLR